ncbi:hypothetical protein CRI94_14535 [Longibacter salinarum]|uniref:DUF2914 domain-containing protein n=1 Tax=Longibacter salinarum TaxID=1850348 RepID=A0A2A8CUS1_9BACT|nr:DUF2914 domain-containing protein [Longibacter salinarum]PEN12253.1 hypothetical protein CRI94_14535 [Longibacter salinarum]
MSTDVAATEAAGSAAGFLGSIMNRLDASPRYRLARLFYRRHENLLPPTLFLGGVGWDAATLRRIDAIVDNVFLAVYLALLGAFIMLTAFDRAEKLKLKPLKQISGWSTGAIQFLCGGLFSAYVIYYTQSASLTTASLFLLVLVTLLVANEFMWERTGTGNLYILFGIYFLAVFCYFTFFLPIVFGTMGYGLFILSGIVSALIVGSMLFVLFKAGVFPSTRAYAGAASVVVGLLLLVNLFYVQHWIPPVPLALRHGGMYRGVEVQGEAYALKYAKPDWYAFWEDPDEEVIEYAPGDEVHCFAAVFAPTELETNVYHRWQTWNQRTESWVSTDRIGYGVEGGRDNGYRGSTFKRNVQPGKWRVTIETEDRRPIGRVNFEIVRADTSETREYGTRLYY